MELLVELVVIFFVTLIGGYIGPAASYYWLYHVRGKNQGLEPIQHRRPTAKDIRREIQLSMVTVVIFSIMGLGLYQLYKAGHTSIYWRLRDYPYGSLFVFVFVAFVVHDFYFYWTHRLMHWRRIFKYVHLGHHRSVSPTPWAIYAFQPLEAVIQFLGICLIVVFVPMHPLGLLLFFWIDAQVNTAGHTGYEIVPRFLSQSRWFSGLSTVTHHDLHHTHTNKNFGAFFTVWDRWMGTFLEDEVAATDRAKQQPIPPEIAEHEPVPQKQKSRRESTSSWLPQSLRTARQ